MPGTRGHEFVGELAPVPGELVVRKYRSSGFWGTNLELLLRSNGIQTVVAGGCTTEGCVESTARDAMFADHYVVIADDCVGSDDKAQHDASMLLMSHRFDMASGSRIAAVWRAAGTSRPDNSKKRVLSKIQLGQLVLSRPRQPSRVRGPSAAGGSRATPC